MPIKQTSAAILILTSLCVVPLSKARTQNPALKKRTPASKAGSSTKKTSSFRQKSYRSPAQESPTKNSGLSGVWGLVGADLGPQYLSASSPEVNKFGFGFAAKGLLSMYRQPWAIDAGLGWYYSRLDGSDDRVSTRVRTQSAFVELSPRVNLAENVQLGPYFQLHFGTDNSYSETIENNNLALFGGAHLNFDFPQNSYLMRVGTYVLTDINVADRQLWVAMIGVQFGIPLSHDEAEAPKPRQQRYEPIPENEVPLVSQAVPPVESEAPEVPSEPIAQVIAPQQVLVRLPSDHFLFDTGMSHLRMDMREYLLSLGNFLATHPESWQQIEITGHTDRRGSRKINQNLSQSRARTVYDVLVEGGVSAERMTHAGKAYDQPVDPANNAEAYRKNRRTELKVLGVSKPELFSEEINQLDSQYRRENNLRIEPTAQMTEPGKKSAVPQTVTTPTDEVINLPAESTIQESAPLEAPAASDAYPPAGDDFDPSFDPTAKPDITNEPMPTDRPSGQVL